MTVMRGSSQEDQTIREEEKTDRFFMEWREWGARDAKDREERSERLEEVMKKEKHWELYREFSRLIEGNTTRWLERR